MATTIICITKDDINVRRAGLHYDVVLNNSVILNFTEDALNELLHNFDLLKED